MTDGTKLQWVSGRDDLRFPGSGLLEEIGASERIGALGFRAGSDGCELWFKSGEGSPDWGVLVQRVTDQARKAKYRFATLIGDEPVSALAAALAEAGFAGVPLSRALFCDAPDELQPYLDWRGRIARIAEGKGSESINAQLYAMAAGRFADGVTYSEVEVNAILNEWHLYGDQSGLRRELIDRGLLGRTRDCRQYWRVSDQDRAR
jgi:hypothetical protein